MKKSLVAVLCLSASSAMAADVAETTKVEKKEWLLLFYGGA